MKKSKIFGYTLVLVLLVSSNFIVPFLGINGIYGNETNFSTDTEHRFNTKQVEDSLPQLNSNKKNDKQLILDKKTSVFGQDLENYITELSMQSKPISGQMKFIMMFREGIEKQTRLNYLDSIFTNYKLIYNYDVFSGVYVQLDLYELVENYDTLKNEGLISKIYKSKIFQTPIFGDNYLAAQPLNESAYENWWLPAIGADNLEYDGSGVRVAVVDSGIYGAHPDLKLALDRDFVANDSVGEDNNGHGTHVAGIIASSGASSGGKYVGVAPGVELINAKAGNSTGSLESGNIINAIEWSAKPVADGGAGADIISMSFGGGFPIAHEPLSAAIIAISREYDVIMVASAGNSGPDYFTGSSPASGVSIISVGATDKNNNLASFSSWGPTFTYLGYPDVAAPGVNIFSTLSKDSIIAKQELFVGDYADYADNGDYMPLSGTSMACPMVSGALALILSAYPEISVETARIALMEGAKKLPDSDDDDTVRSGIGLINVKASLEFLEEKTDKDDVAKVFPDSLPIKPNTLLNFPGDKQRFNLSIFSGQSGTYDLVDPSISGITIEFKENSDRLAFSESGVGFSTFDISIDKDCSPGEKTFQIELRKGGEKYDTVNVSFEVKLPEYKVLMESYHGATDWFPSLSYSQIGYYEAMIDMAGLNLSVDYDMDYWTPDYNSTTDASILTEEKLSQYDLVVFQTPFIPFSPLEIDNIENYYNNGGNMLFLGTRHNDLCANNINFFLDDAGIRIRSESVAEVEEDGLGATIYIQNVTLDNDHPVFDGVDQFLWGFGNTFDVSGNAQSIAEIDGKTVVAAYDGTSEGKGKMVAFGGHHWMHYYYNDPRFENDHGQLLNNLISYLLPKKEISLSIELDEYRTSDDKISLSVYIKNQTNNVLISKSLLQSSFKINGSSGGLTFKNGMAYSFSYDLPDDKSATPYNLIIEFDLDQGYNKTIKILHYDENELPGVDPLTTPNDLAISRENGQSIDINAELDDYLESPISFLEDFEFTSIKAHLSLFTYSFFNEKTTLNKTVSLTNSFTSQRTFTGTFDPSLSDPSGYAVYYIAPKTDEGYVIDNSPRSYFILVDFTPIIIEDQSFFDYGEGDIAFEDTYSSQGSQIYQLSQGSDVNFSIEARDFEDDSNELDVFVILFMAQITKNNSLSIMIPSTTISEKLRFYEGPSHHSGIFTIPTEMEFSSIEGAVNVSTTTDFNPNTGGDYLALFYINVVDQDGGTISDPFAIILSIEPGFNITSFWIVLLVLGGIVGVIIVVLKTRKSKSTSSQNAKRDDVYFQPPSKESSYYGKTREESEYKSEGSSLTFCPNCGEKLKGSKNFCPNCGEKLPFKK